MFIIEWFTSMSLAGQIFACIAIPATLVLIVQTVMMLIGAGSSDADGLGDDLPEDITKHIWVLPIGIHFLQEKSRMFNEKITGYVQKNLRNR